MAVERLLIGFDGLVEDLLQHVLAANLEVVLGEGGLLDELLVFQVGGADLGGVFRVRTWLRILPQKSGVQETSTGAAQTLLVRPVLATEEVRRLPELFGRLQGGSDGDGGPVLGARFGDDGTSGHVVLEVLLDVLVVDVELVFEGVQLGLVENLPPVAAEHRVLGAGDLPAGLVLEVDGGFLVVGSGGLGRRGR